jgi:hypothetical protein
MNQVWFYSPVKFGDVYTFADNALNGSITDDGQSS